MITSLLLNFFVAMVNTIIYAFPNASQSHVESMGTSITTFTNAVAQIGWWFPLTPFFLCATFIFVVETGFLSTRTLSFFFWKILHLFRG